MTYNKNIKWCFLFLLVLLHQHANSSTKELIFKEEKIFNFSPVLFNSKFFNFEFGYMTNKIIKRFNYSYNAYAQAFVAEESYATSEQLRAGALGFKGGVIMPLGPWYPVFLQAAIGYAKTALHKDPWFGQREKTNELSDMFLLEAGGLIAYGNLLFRGMYQINNVKYFTRKTYFSLGVAF